MFYVKCNVILSTYYFSLKAEIVEFEKIPSEFGKYDYLLITTHFKTITIITLAN